MKNINFDKLEILSPAGNPECFYANINNGCNAVYLGLSEFNARLKAENFTEQNIREYVKFAHKFGVKVYITVNTLIKDTDFDKFLDMIKILTEAKVDAFIVQDLGIAHLLKSSFDNIILHASTQMGIHNLNGAKIAERMGISRIVLSRETTLEDIKQIKQNTNLEIEYFVQGALCVAFSGNCYFSSLEKSASGNEGKCLQLCRLPYKNSIDNKTAYYLSARDLSLLENLETLINAGVTSFKIEGRMRHAGYTASATKIYRTALDLIKTNSLTKQFFNESEHNLKISYSRGDYNKNAYLEKSKDETIINSDYQNHIGIKIGTVKKIEPFKKELNKATLKIDTEIFEGDGLKIIDPKTKTQVASLGVGNIDKNTNNEYVIYTKSNFSSGLDVHLTQSSKQEKILLKTTKRININIKIHAFAGKPLVVFAFANNISSKFSSDYNLEPATKSPISKEDFKSQFEKLSDTNFTLNTIEVETDGIFLPKSKINEARRQIIKLIEDAIIIDNEKHLSAKFNDAKYKNLLCTKITTTPANIAILHSLDKNFKKDPALIYVYDPNIYHETDIKNVQQILGPQFALNVPTILNYEDNIIFENILNSLPTNTILYANNLSAFIYAYLGFNIIASPLTNIKNTFAIKCLNSLNITTICASIEADDKFATKNNLITFESGEFPLMTFAHCPFKVILKNICDKCKYSPNLSYSNQNLGTYKIRRTKLKNCQFQMTKNIQNKSSKFFVENLNY